MERHYFAGANTPGGFFSYFSHILDPQAANRIYILKGGSGVGKSTAIRHISKHLSAMGYAVEYIRCSSDFQSFDGFCVPELAIAMIDGTAPHMVDPTIPGASEIIVNLGDFLDNDALVPHKAEIASHNKQKAALYRKAYAYLAAAQQVQQHTNTLYDAITEDAVLYSLAQALCAEIFPQPRNRTGACRKLFAEAITGQGYVNYATTLFEGYTLYAMDQELPRNSARLLQLVADYAHFTGYDIECFYNTYDPSQICHLGIPSLGIAITCDTADGANTIPLSNSIDADKLAALSETLSDNYNLLSTIITYAIKALSQTKAHHDALEHIYSAHVDFAEVDTVVAEICACYTTPKEDCPC